MAASLYVPTVGWRAVWGDKVTVDSRFAPERSLRYAAYDENLAFIVEQNLVGIDTAWFRLLCHPIAGNDSVIER